MYTSPSHDNTYIQGQIFPHDPQQEVAFIPIAGDHHNNNSREKEKPHLRRRRRWQEEDDTTSSSFHQHQHHHHLIQGEEGGQPEIVVLEALKVWIEDEDEAHPQYKTDESYVLQVGR